MTIEEIRQAKRDAEERIRQELKSLMERTGMHAGTVKVEYVDYYQLSPAGRRRSVGEVRIDLRVP